MELQRSALGNLMDRGKRIFQSQWEGEEVLWDKVRFWFSLLASVSTKFWDIFWQIEHTVS